MKDFSLISGRQPVEEALQKAAGIEKIWLARGTTGPFEKLLRQQCQKRIIPLSYVDKNKLDRLTRSNHQGVVAMLTPLRYLKIDELIPHLMESSGHPLIVLTDGVTDVRNIGAIARSCEALGADALVLPTDKSALINEFAFKASAGALLSLPICRINSLVNSVQYLLNSGFEVVGLHEGATSSIQEFASGGGPMALIVGDEEKGIRRPILELCTQRVHIPMSGKRDSLNVSVATGIALYALHSSLDQI